MDPDQLASKKQADQELHYIQSRIDLDLVWKGLIYTDYYIMIYYSDVLPASLCSAWILSYY